DSQKIAFEVRWHDMRADTAATNAPTLEVPLADEEIGASAAAAPAGPTDVWGEPQGAPAPAQKPSGGGSDVWGESPAAGAEGQAPAAEFSEGVAIQLPATAPEGVAKPYFLFGNGSRPVDLWFLDLASQRVHQYSGRGSAGLTALEGGEVEGS